MQTTTGTTAAGDVIVNLVKAPVLTFEQDYSMWNTESHRTGIVLRRSAQPCVERCVFHGDIQSHATFIVPNEHEPYQGAITRARLLNANQVHLYGISTYDQHRSLIAEMYEGETLIDSHLYDRYQLSDASGAGKVSLYSDLSVSYSEIGHVLTQGYSSLRLKDVSRIGSIYALTLEPKGTKVRFAVSFDGHKSYKVFRRKELVDICDDPAAIADYGNSSTDLCYGFRNMKPGGQIVVDFKIVLQSDNPDATPVFYGFRCSLYSTINSQSEG